MIAPVYKQSDTQTHTHMKGTIMSSNPFELRFKILEMAQSYLQDQVQRNQDYFSLAWELAQGQGEANQELWNELQPDSYTIEDIKRKASELYEFVEKK